MRNTNSQCDLWPRVRRYRFRVSLTEVRGHSLALFPTCFYCRERGQSDVWPGYHGDASSLVCLCLMILSQSSGHLWPRWDLLNQHGGRLDTSPLTDASRSGGFTLSDSELTLRFQRDWIRFWSCKNPFGSWRICVSWTPPQRAPLLLCALLGVTTGNTGSVNQRGVKPWVGPVRPCVGVHVHSEKYHSVLLKVLYFKPNWR